MKNFDLDRFVECKKDFPKKGIMFRDISPLLSDHNAMQQVTKIFSDEVKKINQEINLIAGIESRGFLFSTLLANSLGIGSIMIRKPGKLPGEIIEKNYSLEYGESRLSIQKSKAIINKNIIIIDDLIATGGSLSCAESLITSAKANVIACFTLIELRELKGSRILKSKLFSIKQYN